MRSENRKLIEIVYNVIPTNKLHPQSEHLESRIRFMRGVKGIGKYDYTSGFFTVICDEEYKENIIEFLNDYVHSRGVFDITRNINKLYEEVF